MNDRELEKLAPWNEDVKADLLKSVEAEISAKRFWSKSEYSNYVNCQGAPATVVGRGFCYADR